MYFIALATDYDGTLRVARAVLLYVVASAVFGAVISYFAVYCCPPGIRMREFASTIAFIITATAPLENIVFNFREYAFHRLAGMVLAAATVYRSSPIFKRKGTGPGRHYWLFAALRDAPAAILQDVLDGRKTSVQPPPDGAAPRMWINSGARRASDTDGGMAQCAICCVWHALKNSDHSAEQSE